MCNLLIYLHVTGLWSKYLTGKDLRACFEDIVLQAKQINESCAGKKKAKFIPFACKLCTSKFTGG